MQDEKNAERDELAKQFEMANSTSSKKITMKEARLWAT